MLRSWKLKKTSSYFGDSVSCVCGVSTWSDFEENEISWQLVVFVGTCYYGFEVFHLDVSSFVPFLVSQ